MRLFWKVCSCAAIGFVVLALIWIISIGLADSGLCRSDKGAISCPGLPGTDILTFIFILPLAVFIGAPIFLFLAITTLLNTGSLSHVLADTTLNFKITTALAYAWFVLGVIGLVHWLFSLKALFHKKTKS